MSRSIVAGFVILAMLGAACSGQDPAPPASPTSAFPADPSTASGPSGTTPSGATGAPGGAGAGSGDLTQGVLNLKIAGDVELETSLPRVITGIVTPAPGAFAIVWASAGADATTVGVGGGSFVGTQASSPTLVLTITAQTADGLFTWISDSGGCEVRLTTADADRFEGAFTCDDVEASSGEVVSVSASFEATG